MSSAEVDEWFSKYDNPMKAVVQRIRELVLAADPRMEECIKWQAPTFSYLGNLASFFPKSKKHASLMFHQGAQIPGKHPLLEGTGDTARSLKLDSVEAADAAAEQITAIVLAWCDWREQAGGTSAKKVSAKNKRAAKKSKAKKSAAKKPSRKTTTKKKAAKQKVTKKPAKKGTKKKAATKVTKKPAKKSIKKTAKVAKKPASKKSTSRRAKRA